MFGRMSVRWAVLVAVGMLVAPLALVSAGATTGPASARSQRALTAAAFTGSPCQWPGACEPVVGTAAGMAVPLIRPWVRGTDGGWNLFTSCCSEVNPNHRASVSGTLNDKPATVVPGGSEDSGGIVGTGSSTVIYNISGTSYRLARLLSKVTRTNLLNQVGATDWLVNSDLYAYACSQRGSTRVPAVDCGTGTHQFTRGHAEVAMSEGDTVYTIAVPINYYVRSVDFLGRPLGTPYRSSTGHWTLNAERQYQGWLWTVEWSVNGVATARIAGSSFSSGSHITLTDGPFA
jgi:hypothetical protein